MPYTFGAIKSPPDYRDYIYGQIVPLGTAPEKFLLEEFPVREQGSFGTCVGQAASGVKDWQEYMNYQKEIQTSPLFVYAECKKIDGIPHQEGTYLRTAMKVLKDLGICKESTFPYSLMTGPAPPNTSPKARQEATWFVIGAYAQTQTLAEIKQALLLDGPVLCGVYATMNFLEPETGGFIPMPGTHILGGHAMVVTGWDDTLKHTYKNRATKQGFLRVRNSWGSDWGDNGYCWIPYDYLSVTTNGAPLWMEAWSSVDVVLPPPGVRRLIVVPEQHYALVDGEKVLLDQPATIHPKTHRILIPLRFMSETLGLHVHWDGKQAIITRGDV